jgi:hypothetical protein
VSAGGVFGGKLSFKRMSAGGRLCTLQENPHFWVPTIKVRPPDGNSVSGARAKSETCLDEQQRDEVPLFYAIL